MTTVFVGLFIILGLIGGSFLGVVVTRGPIVWGFVPRPDGLPDGYGLAFPRSHCPACRHPIPVTRLIPGLGYFLAKGRCANCGTRISPTYPSLEWSGGIAGALAAIVAPSPIMAGFLLVFALALLALAVIDARTGYLPDAITLPLIGLGLAASFLPGGLSPLTSLIAATLGYGVFWGISAGYKLLRGRDGLGLGDAKLLAGIAAFVGPYALPFVVLIGAGSALTLAVFNAVRGQDLAADTMIRFGPYLAAGGAVVAYSQLALG